jgi:trimeric autotransporter adhesin
MKILNMIVICSALLLNAETLFEVKDASNNKVLDVSTDGLRVLNNGDTLMVISADAIRANISSSKGLSRSFSVTTASSKGKGLINALQVDAGSATMTSPLGQYTDFSPLNIFMGLEAGASVVPGKYNVMIGNYAGYGTVGVDDFSYYGWSNTFLGESAGRNATNSSHNVYIGKSSGANSANGGDNTFIGSYSGQNNNGSANTFIGSSSGGNGTGAGSYNAYLGYLSGAYTTTGSYNVMLGDRAGYNLRAGSNNVSLGYRAGYQNQSGVGNVMIGHEAGYSETGSNKLYVANTNTTTPLIKGTFPNTDLTFTASTININHATGISNGLYIKNSSNTNYWHFYQYSTGRLSLFYNGAYRGEWNIDTGAYTSTSDRRLKKNVREIERVTEKIAKIEPKTYAYSDQSDPQKKYTGLIAQDVAEIFPEFVSYNHEEDVYTIDYAGLSVIALQGIKEQNSEIEDLRNKNIELEKRLEAIEKKLKE